jgi:ComF family protein
MQDHNLSESHQAVQSLRKQVATILKQGLDTILPPRCVVTGEMVQQQGMIAASAWAKLDFIHQPMCETCGFPFEFQVDAGSLCTSCLSDPPVFTQARMALKYNDASRSMILGFKHADQTHAVKAFTPWMMKAGAPFLPQADLLAPVPLHHWRLVSRRYNQAALIAQDISRHCAVPSCLDLLQRVRATPSQGYLKAAERHKNVKNAFALNPKYKDAIKGKKIVLIDDVYTTGATIKECTKVLLKQGAGAVYVLTLARVIRSEYFS